MLRRIGLIGVLLLIGTVLSAQEEKPGKIFPVTFVSPEFVYVKGGTANGLAPGMELVIVRNKREAVAAVKVVFAAEHSASCRLVRLKKVVQPGDLAVMIDDESRRRLKEMPEVTPSDSATAPPPMSAPEKPSRRPPVARISGYLSLQTYRVEDSSPRNLDFTQPTLRLNLHAYRLFRREISLKLRSRSRLNWRTRNFGDSVPRKEWRHRVYEFSLGYDNLRAPLNFRMGRMADNFMSGVGQLDGLQVQVNALPGMRLGIFYGSQPHWRSSAWQWGARKYGAYARIIAGNTPARRWESTLAAVAEYHFSTVSREYVYLQSFYEAGERVSVYGSAEMDVNRHWRKAKAGERFSLTNLYIAARYRSGRELSLGLTVDNRKNYWSYEVRTLADSLFDEALRMGARGDLTVQLPGHWMMTATAGVRRRTGQTRPMYSYSGSIRRANLSPAQLSLSAHYAGFSGPFTWGSTASAAISKGFLAGHRLSLSYGQYRYRFVGGGDPRRNQWARLGGYFNLGGHLFLWGQYEYSWGSDLNLLRLWGEVGYRF
ncbi:MAG: hypothetical protein D6681_11430 [Calditrichaeota bacterium]|nr:MAG: hypothetical protein D6681_11430 [Calditrichota bacterium]